MSAINSDTRDAWQAIANLLSDQRPSPGKRVRVSTGRRKGQEGVVVRHQQSKFSNAFRYASDAQAHMREMAGRSGYCVLVRPSNGPEFWADANKVEVIPALEVAP